MPDPPFRPDRSIALVGMMGAGKSTVGRRLAKRLELPFLDSDAEIERSAGRTVADIFEKYGEAAFRDVERRVIARLATGPAAVIATGGGAFIDPDTRTLILDRCIAVWLDSEPALLAERAGRKGTRPLLKGKDPLPFLRALAAERNGYYAEAPIVIRNGNEPRERVVDRIIEALREAGQ